MKKEIFLPKNLKIIEQAEILADIEARQKGFAKKSARWEKAKQKYLEERYYHSSIPHVKNELEAKSNPGTPHVPWILYKEFESLFAQDGWLARRVGYPSAQKGTDEWKRSKFGRYEMRLRKLVTDLIHIILEIEFALQIKDEKTKDGQIIKPSDFRIVANYSQDDMMRVYTNIYVRYTVSSLVISGVSKILSLITRDKTKAMMLEAKDQVEAQGLKLPLSPGSSTKGAREALKAFVNVIKSKL